MPEQDKVVEEISAKIMAEIEPKVSAGLKLVASVIILVVFSLFGGSFLQTAVAMIVFHLIADDIFAIWW